jgi:hypothetical protein
MVMIQVAHRWAERCNFKIRLSFFSLWKSINLLPACKLLEMFSNLWLVNLKGQDHMQDAAIDRE